MALLLSLVGGCYVRVYQPLSGLHRPVVVDTQLPNFQDVHLTVRCVPGGLLLPQDANTLCQKVGTLFENQGAVVATVASATDEPDESDVPKDAPRPPTDLTLELRSREISRSDHLVSWLLFFGSFTLIPGVTESTFAQDVVIRDSTGFVLISDSLQGRIVIRQGFGSWAVNKLADAIARKKEDRLTGEAMNRDLSTDLYRQLSQLLFNAEMKWQVLRQVPSTSPRAGSDPARPSSAGSKASPKPGPKK